MNDEMLFLAFLRGLYHEIYQSNKLVRLLLDKHKQISQHLALIHYFTGSW